MAWSTYMIARVVKHCLREGAAMGANGGAWLSLHTADPGLTGASEVTGGTYGRQDVSGVAKFPTVTGDSVVNSAAAIDFTLMPACTVTHVGLWDSQTTGGSNNFIGGAALDASKTVNAGDTFSFPTSSLTLSLAGTRGYSTYLGIALLKHALLQTTFGQPAANGVSLHTADPGETGASEVTGGAGPYARQTPTFANASGGAKALSAALNFTGMPACTVNYVGIWDAASAGNFLFAQTVAALAKTVNAGDTFQIPGTGAGLTVTIS